MGDRWVLIGIVAVIVGLGSVATAQTGIEYETETVTGTFTTTGGAAVPWQMTLRARAMDATGSESTASVNANGEYTFTLPAGRTYRIDALYQWTVVDTWQVDLVDGVPQTHDFRFAAGELSVAVTRNGLPDHGATIQIVADDAAPGCFAAGASCSGDAEHCQCVWEATGRMYSCALDPVTETTRCIWHSAFSTWANTDASGNARALVPIGSYQLTVGSSRPMDAMMQSGFITIASASAVSVGENTVTSLGPYPYQTAVVTGQVLQGGAPVTNVTIHANAGFAGQVSTPVDSLGRYRFELPTIASYVLEARQDGMSLIDSEQLGLLLPGQEYVVDFEVSGTLLTGSVVADGAPASGAGVFISQQPPTACGAPETCMHYTENNCLCEAPGSGHYECWTHDGAQWQCWWMSGVNQFSVFTDAAGNFSKAVPPGTYSVRIASAPPPFDMMMMQWGSVEVANLSDIVVGATAVNLGTFSYSTGTVGGTATSCGIPLTNLSYSLRNPSGTITSMSMGGNTYSLRAPHGSYTLEAQLQGAAVQSTPMTIGSSPQTWDVAYDLGTLRGYISRDGEPSTNSQVLLQEVPVGLSCSAERCDMYHPDMMSPNVCFGCTSDSGRRYWCMDDGCHFEMAQSVWSNTQGDGTFTADVSPGRWHVVAFSSSSGDPMGGGQSGGIVIGTFDVDVAACSITDVNTAPVSVPTGTVVEVPLGSGIALTFDEVTAGGEVTFVASAFLPEEAEQFEPDFQSAGLFYDIIVPLSFEGRVRVCLPYDDARVTPETDLALYHQGPNGWEDITEYPIDTVNHIVCGYTTSFSWFVVGIAASSQPDLVIDGPLVDIPVDSACQASAVFSASGASAGESYTWFIGNDAAGSGASVTLALLLGTSTVRVLAGTREATHVVHAVDTTAPVLRSVAASPAVLWPPNGKLTSIEAVTAIEDNCDTSPTITAIGADSPRAVPTDVVVTPAGISVRAFRAGNETQGRTYTLRYVVSDDAGNSVPAMTTVHVPHDQR